MGIASLSGNQFFERVYLVFVPKAAHPRKVPYVRNVGTRKMHLFTLIQALCVGALWVRVNGRKAGEVGWWGVLLQRIWYLCAPRGAKGAEPVVVSALVVPQCRV